MNEFVNTAPSGSPQNFDITAEGNSLVLSWEPPPSGQRNGVIISYTLSCNPLGELILNSILGINLYELNPNTLYSCRIAASTAVGIGPYTDMMSATTGGISIQP